LTALAINRLFLRTCWCIRTLACGHTCIERCTGRGAPSCWWESRPRECSCIFTRCGAPDCSLGSITSSSINSASWGHGKSKERRLDEYWHQRIKETIGIHALKTTRWLRAHKWFLASFWPIPLILFPNTQEPHSA
jgi:hypothetical protein